LIILIKTLISLKVKFSHSLFRWTFSWFSWCIHKL